MKIQTLTIDGIGGIEHLVVNFDEGFNFICGPNGIGKTTILECVGHSFSVHGTDILKRKASSACGKFTAIVNNDGTTVTTEVNISSFEPNTPSHINTLHQYAKSVLSLKANRTLQYQNIDAVRKDRVGDDSQAHQEAMHGVNAQEIKSWFINRYLYSAHPGALTDEQLHNLALAKNCFSLLNPDFTFSQVVASSNEIMINTPGGQIYFEYLSSGFKSSLSIVFGIIKDIELRFKSPTKKADDFNGIILIDELELHLHPEWQSKIGGVLAGVFPNAQFIVATHSPHIIQAAQPKEIIALAAEDGRVVRRQLDNSEYGYQGWTIEEVLTDVMGMTDTRTAVFHGAVDKFEAAIAAENFEDARVQFETLDKLLHPQNYLRKILQLDLATIREVARD